MSAGSSLRVASRLLACAIAMLGCAPNATPSSATSGAASTSPAETDALGTSTVRGEVRDLAGAPIVDMFVTVSDEYCVPDRSSAAGTFVIEQVEDGTKRLISYGETATDGPFASIVLAIEIAGDTSLVSPVRVPRLDERHPIDLDAEATQTITTLDGLALDVEPGALTLAPFFDPELLVARVPIADAPDFVPDGVELVDLFVLHPIRSTFEPPAAIRFPANPALEPGAAVTFHTLDYDTGQLSPVASGTVSPEGAPVSAPGEGIAELTWIGVSVDAQGTP